MKFKVKYKSLLNGSWTEPMEVIIEAADKEGASDRFASVHKACFGTVQEYQILEIDIFSKLKPIEAPWTYYQIAEDAERTPYLTQKETGEILHLFKVLQPGFVVFVLVTDKEGALSQASCHDSWNADLEASAKQIPFMLRGWSGHTF